MNLGDQFPASFKTDYSHRALAVGSVIRCLVHDTIERGTGNIKPKEKFWIIVGIDSAKGELATVYVNTEIARFIQGRADLMEAQYLLKSDERALVDYDSYADCCQLMVKKTDDIQMLIESHPEFVKGVLNTEELAEVLAKIRNTTNISKILKKRFGLI